MQDAIEAFDDPETYVPEHMRDAYTRYLEYGISPGSFGDACINGNIQTAAERADWINAAHVKSQIEWCKRYAR